MYAQDQAAIATPIGMIELRGDDAALSSTSILRPGEGRERRASAEMVRRAAEQIEAWFAGERRDFDVALVPPATARGRVMRAGLVGIPYGSTMTYGGLARRLDSAPRAIGQLCARNPFPLIVPCHRVLGAGDALAHYSSGEGPATKAWLLDFERRHRARIES